MKRCFKCGVEKPLSEFYRHPRMTDGHLGKCKDCAKRDTKHDRETKPQVREYDRRRAKLPHRAALRSRIAKAWNAKHPHRRKAQVAAGNAVRDRKLQKPKNCQRCGLERRVEKHHPDYALPLLIEWLCKSCHVIADAERRQREKAS